MKNHLFKVNQRQRYAIRKFSVGIGSTLIGVTLFLGMQNHAHAAENSESKTQQNTEENNASSTPNQQATSPDAKLNTNNTSTVLKHDQNQSQTKPAQTNDSHITSDVQNQQTSQMTKSTQQLNSTQDQNQNNQTINKKQTQNEAKFNATEALSKQTSQQANTHVEPSQAQPSVPQSKTFNTQSTQSQTQHHIVQRQFVKPVSRAYVANNGIVNVDDDSFTFTDLKNAFNDANVSQINFNSDHQFDFTEGLKLNRGLIINVANGKKVDFNAAPGQAQKLIGIDASLGNGQALTINNDGQLNFNNFNKGIAVHGGDSTTQLNINGGETNFNNFNQSGIDTSKKFAGQISIQDAHINTNSTRDSTGSTLLLGDSFDSKLNVNHSTLNLVNNGDSPTSNAIESNSGIVNFNDSNIYSSSRAHYNFNIFNPDHRRGDQQVNFSNTDLKVNTPTDANPYKSIWIFKVPVDAVGINSEFTHFNVTNNSTISQNINGFTGDEKGIELEHSTLTVANGTLDLRSVGFDKGSSLNSSLAWPSLIDIKDDSKVTIDKFHDLPSNSNVSTDFPKIIISGGSVSLPLDEKGNAKVPTGT